MIQRIFQLIEKKGTGGEQTFISQEARMDSVESRAEIQRPRVQRGNIFDKWVESQESNNCYSKVDCQVIRWMSQEQRLATLEYRVR